MASCDIQVVNPSVLSRIESFLNDPSYREVIENSSNYNTRLCIERRLRLPFLDSQTGVAQNHSTLWMNQRERIPGLNEGQVYTYPSKRWRKKRRQYLMHGPIIRPSEGSILDPSDLHTISTIENPAAAVPSDDSKDSALKDDSSAKATSQDAWYLDELELSAIEGLDEGDQDSDYDYEETYTKRRKKRGPPGKPPRSSLPIDSPHPKKIPKTPGVGRGRKKGLSYDASDTEKPFSCDLCGARYKTRPGLTYHYTHSHKEKSRAEMAAAVAASTSGVPPPNGNPTASCSTMTNLLSGGGLVSPPVGTAGPPEEEQAPASPHNPLPGWTKFQDTYLTYLNTPGGDRPRPPGRPPGQIGGSNDDLPPMTGPSAEKKLSSIHQEQPMLILEQQNDKERAAPSLYCDFCLGDASANKKSGQPEDLVSCSDCGRSGHPTCLQFTDNMIISVRKYRWQCIECKCCSICGTSDNDDQLLFCDDCDRGYHMYCLVPPLTTPPEGSWSCRLCLIEFHAK